MRSLLGHLVWLLIVIPASIGGVVAVNWAYPELFGQASEVITQPTTTQSLYKEEKKAEVVADVSNDVPSTVLFPDTGNATYTTVNNHITNPTSTIEKTIDYDFDDVTEDRIIYINSDEELDTINEGESGQVLQATGDGLPEWVNLGTLSADWENPGEIGATTPNTAAFTDLAVGSSSDFQVLDSGRLELTYNGDSGSLSSSGGALFINNTDNIGTGIGIYSNAGGSAQGNMINVKVDNAAYNQAAFYMNYDGISNAVEIVSNTDDSSSNALAVTGNNISDSTVGIIGYELARGTIKITHNRPGTGNDSSASGLSIDLKGSGTRAQGVYVDSTESGGTLGNLLRLRNESIDKFVVNYQGNLAMAGNFAQGANGTDTTFTKYGNTAGDEFFIGTNAAGRFQRSASNSEVFRAQIAGDANGRWVGTSDGRLRWGDGTNATDVTLRRIGTARLGVEGGMTLNNLNADADTVIKGQTDSNLLYVDSSADNVGIGTSGPGFKLDVSGTGRFTGALRVDTLASGATDTVITHASGVLQQRTIDSRVWGSTLVDGSGTSNYLARWSDSNTLTTGVVYDDGTNVGIGTTVAGAKLHVFGGDIWLENTQALRIKDSGGTARPVLAYTSGNNVQLYGYATTGIVQIGINNVSNTAGNIRFFTNNNVERVRIDPAGLGVGATAFGTGAVNVLAIASSTAPSTSITDGIQLFAVDEGGSHELRVRDEAGNASTISPHNFSIIPDGLSESMAWSYYSERDGVAISADMTKALRLVEGLSGVQLVYQKNLQTGEYLGVPDELASASIDKSDRDFAKELEKYVSLESLAGLVSWDDEVWSFLSEAVFSAKATFEKTVVFLADITFGGKITVSKDTAGRVVIPAGATSLSVQFDSEYDEAPLVYLTPVGGVVEGFSVKDVSPDSFTIQLEDSSSDEIVFNWLAVMGENGGSEVEAHFPDPSPTPEPEVAGAATESAIMDDEATSSAEASPSATPDLDK